MKKSVKSNKKSPFKPRFTWSNKDKAGYLDLQKINKQAISYTRSHDMGKYMINYNYDKKDELLGIEILKLRK